jgi:hypothetical protein
MDKKLFVAEGWCKGKVYAPTREEARRKYNELLRNPVLHNPFDRLGDATYQPSDRSNVSEMCRIREATEEEVRNVEAADLEREEREREEKQGDD